MDDNDGGRVAVVGSSVSAELVNRTLTSRREDLSFCQKYLSETLGIYLLTPDLVLDILSKRRDWQQQQHQNHQRQSQKQPSSSPVNTKLIQ